MVERHRGTDTGTATKKKGESAMIGSIDSYDFGGAYVLDHVQRDAGIGRDLMNGMGRNALNIMTCAFSLVQSNGSFDAVPEVMKRTWTTRMYEMADFFSHDSFYDQVRALGRQRAGMIGFSASRVKRARFVNLWVGGSFVTTAGINGIPLMYNRYNESGPDLVSILSVDMNECGCDPVFVLDREYCTVPILRYLTRNGRGFVCPSFPGEPLLDGLVEGFEKAEKVRMNYSDYSYDVFQTTVVVPEEGDGLAADGFGIRIKACVCRCSWKCDDEGVKVFRRCARYCEDRHGTFVMLMPEDVGWSDAMSEYESAKHADMVVHRNAAECKEMCGHDADLFHGAEFLGFLALILKEEVDRCLRMGGAPPEVNAERLVSALDSVQVREKGSTLCITPIGHDESVMFGYFGIILPKKVPTDMRICDYTAEEERMNVFPALGLAPRRKRQ